MPYWGHNGHTAQVLDRTESDDGTADITLSCECGESWSVAIGVEDSEVPPEG